jgi:hypothetical protein
MLGVWLAVLVLGAPPSLLPPVPEGRQETAASAVVSGRVVDALTGRPIPGVVITPDGSAVAITPANPLAPRALSNGDGAFVLRGLGKGRLHLTAAKSGYTTAAYNQRRPGGASQMIPVDEGERVNGIEIRMWRHASLTGTIVDEAGEAAVGVRVQAFRQSFVAGRRRFTPAGGGVTDDRGIYRIANLTPGNYAVGVPFTQNGVATDVMELFFGASRTITTARQLALGREFNAIGAPIVPAGSRYAMAVGDQTVTFPPGTLMPHRLPDGGLMVYPTLFYPAAGTLTQASLVSVRSGEERGPIDMQMLPTRSARVSGTVITPDGPAVHVGVRLVPAGADESIEPLDTAATITGAGGRFAFAAVPSGQYVLKVLRLPPEPEDAPHTTHVFVSPSGGVTVASEVGSAAPPPVPIPADATLYAHVPIAVGSDEISGLVVALAAAPRVSGRIEFEGTGDKPAGSALTNIRINLDPADGTKIPNRTIAFEAGHPDEDGRFRTFGVPPGKYVLRANPPSGWFFKGAYLGGADLSDLPFEISGKDLAGVVITFTDRPATLTGVVRSGQSPDPDAVVVAFPVDSAAWQSRGAYPRRMRIGRTERDGSYTITPLLPGEYHVVAIHEEMAADLEDPSLLEALARVSRQVRLLDGERRTEDLSAAVIK